MEFDKTQFKLLRTILRYGLSKIAPWDSQMDLVSDQGMFVSTHMQAARGGYESGRRGSYGPGAWYISTKSEDECNYRCFVEEYATIFLLWAEKEPPGNNQRVIRAACSTWKNLGGMLLCKDFIPWATDNEMVQLFNSNQQTPWAKGLLQP